MHSQCRLSRGRINDLGPSIAKNSEYRKPMTLPEGPWRRRRRKSTFITGKITVNHDAMFAIKSRVGNLDVAGCFLDGQKTFRQRRALVGQSIFCGNDGQLPFFATLRDKLLCRVSGNHAPAHDDVWIGLYPVLSPA